MKLTTAQRDRACGLLLGTAAGDALGAPYEFQPPRGPELEVEMKASHTWAAGEWTDDTSMAIAIAEVAATGVDLRDAAAQDAVVARWCDWATTAKDVGNQTRAVLHTVRAQGATAANALAASRALHERTGHTAGNGSLMRTAPVVLAFLDDEPALAEAARALSALTHFDPEAGDACVLWCLAMRHAVLSGDVDVRIGLPHIDTGRRRSWSDRLDAAEAGRPADFPNNGWVVTALQAAWSAIAGTDTGGRAERVSRGLDAAVRAGDDTDTVAAIAGGLLGATYGASAVPAHWRRLLHGWPGLYARDLVALVDRITSADNGFPRPLGLPIAVRHPLDDGVWLGNAAALLHLPDGVDVIVSMCRVHDDDLPAGVEQIDVRLVDQASEEANPNLDFVLTDTVQLIAELRREGRTVLVHCHGGYSRTPTMGALYGSHVSGASGTEALAQVLTVLPSADPNPAFRAALNRLAP